MSAFCPEHSYVREAEIKVHKTLRGGHCLVGKRGAAPCCSRLFDKCGGPMAPPTVQVRQLHRESSCRAQMLPERTGTANVRGVRRLGEGVLMVSVGYDRIRYL